jgi:hypothetical protein
MHGEARLPPRPTTAKFRLSTKTTYTSPDSLFFIPGGGLGTLRTRKKECTTTCNGVQAPVPRLPATAPTRAPEYDAAVIKTEVVVPQ